jgi:lipopolysaccharide export system permease protein
MKKLEKYLIKTILQSIFLISMCITVLQIFILFFNELGAIGKGQYTSSKAFWYILFYLPHDLAAYFPIICILGSLVGLSLLAEKSELVIYRVSGISVLNILRMIATTGFFLILSVMILSEYAIPKLTFKAINLKLEALNNGHLLRQSQSIWFHSHQDFWYVEVIDNASSLHHVTRFIKNALGDLESIEFYNQVDWKNGIWQADSVEKTLFLDKKVMSQPPKVFQDIQLDLKPKFFENLQQNPDEMDLITLWNRIHQLKNQQNMAREENAFWQRIMKPLNSLVMMLLAIPFIFGPLRTSTMGAKLITGVAVGFVCDVLGRILGHASGMLQLPIIFGAFIPFLMFAFLGLFLLKKTT